MIQIRKTNNHGVRFTLKQRPVRKDRDEVNISSYNSDFLNGIFEDVAKISGLSGSEDCLKRGSGHLSADSSAPSSHMVCDPPNKKRRTTLNRSLSRKKCSVVNLVDLGHVQSPKAIHELFQASSTFEEKHKPLHLCFNKSMSLCNQEPKSQEIPKLADCKQHDSLAFQLGCVAGSDSSPTSTSTAAIVAFPHLPATVSDSFCSAGLTRTNLIMQASSLETQSKESFGWFVDLDDHQQTAEPIAALPCSVSCEDLAFQAPTAPMGDNNDAQVEWAKAADTVDDVLGDFF